MGTSLQTDDLFRMPALGADMTEGRVLEWLVELGEPVERGQLVAVVETDKSDIEIEVFEPCVFDEHLVEIGELVDIGTPIARITRTEPAMGGSPPATPTAPSPSAPSPSAASPSASVPPTPASAPTLPPTVGAPPSGTTTSAARLTPRARRLARERGIDPATLATDGVVTGDMVAAAASDRTPESADRATTMRRAIASLMERSWAEIPHYHTVSRLDLTDLAARLETYNADRPVADRVVLAAAVNVAITQAAAATPEMNGWWRPDGFEPSASVDLGVVVSLRTGGVVLPTIEHADRLDVEQMMAAMRDVVGRARRGRLRERDARPASISVTNMGDLGTDVVLGIIHPPQVTMVGLGTPRREPAVVDDTVVPRLMMQTSIAGDHRAHDGLAAARFVRRLAQELEHLP